MAPIAGPWIRNRPPGRASHVVRRAGQLRPPPGGQQIGVGPGGEDPLRRGRDDAAEGDRARAHGASSASTLPPDRRAVTVCAWRSGSRIRAATTSSARSGRSTPRRDRDEIAWLVEPARVPVGLHPGHRDRVPARLRHPHHRRRCWTGPASSSTTASRGTTTRCWSQRRPRSRASTPSAATPPLRRLNRIHGHYDIPNDEFQYVLATTIVGPVEWIRRVRLARPRPGRAAGAGQLHHPLRRADGDHGPAHDVRRLPQAAARRTSAERFEFTRPTAGSPRRRCGSAADRPVAAAARFARRVTIALMDEPLRDALGMPEQPAWFVGRGPPRAARCAPGCCGSPRRAARRTTTGRPRTPTATRSPTSARVDARRAEPVGAGEPSAPSQDVIRGGRPGDQNV